MTSELELYLSTHDALHDITLSKTKFGQLQHQWEESRKLLGNRNIDSDYKRVLSFILDKSEQIYDQQRNRKRENAVYIDEEDDSDIELCRISRNRESLQRLDKGKSVVREDYEGKKKKVAFRLDDDEHLYQQSNLAMKSLRNVRNNTMSDREYLHDLHENDDLDNNRYVHMDKHNKTKNLTMEKSGNEFAKVKTERSPSPTSHKKTKNLTALKQSRNDESEKVKIENKDIDENNLQEKGNDASDSEVEILDSVAINEEGLIGPFVPSQKHHKSVGEDRESSAFQEFRKQVLDVLRKPFNKEEYNKHQEAVKDYLDYHPDLKRTLKKYRYKKNVTQEGSFKPWENRECLAVEPGSS